MLGKPKHIKDCRNIKQLGELLQRWGYSVGEHPCFGGVYPVHVPTSMHYVSCAIDVNADGGAHPFWGHEPDEITALNTLFDHLRDNLSQQPTELFYRDRLLKNGVAFTDPPLSAGHMNHLHLGLVPPYGGRFGCTGFIRRP